MTFDFLHSYVFIILLQGCWLPWNILECLVGLIYMHATDQLNNMAVLGNDSVCIVAAAVAATVSGFIDHQQQQTNHLSPQ